MEIEITSCSNCPFGKQDELGYTENCGLEPILDLFILTLTTSIPPNCPIRQDNTITFKLKEDEG